MHARIRQAAGATRCVYLAVKHKTVELYACIDELARRTYSTTETSAGACAQTIDRCVQSAKDALAAPSSGASTERKLSRAAIPSMFVLGAAATARVQEVIPEGTTYLCECFALAVLLTCVLYGRFFVTADPQKAEQSKIQFGLIVTCALFMCGGRLVPPLTWCINSIPGAWMFLIPTPLIVYTNGNDGNVRNAALLAIVVHLFSAYYFVYVWLTDVKCKGRCEPIGEAMHAHWQNFTREAWSLFK
jgi:hypothetical protein